MLHADPMSYFPPDYEIFSRHARGSLTPPSLTSLSLAAMSSTSSLQSTLSKSGTTTPIYNLPGASLSATALHAPRQRPSTSPYMTTGASLSTTSLITPSPPFMDTMQRSRAASISSASSEYRRKSSLPPLPPVPPPKGPVPTPSRSVTQVRARERFDTFEACMEGGIKYETQSAAVGHCGDVAERHLNRAAGLFAAALSYQPDSSWAKLRRATVLLHLSGNATPASAISYLRDARALLGGLTGTNPNATSARETLATVCTKLSAHLHSLDDDADDFDEVWEGEVGRFACEALENLEEVATERMDRVRSLRRDAFECEAPALADMFLVLAEAAGTVATLATDTDTVDSHAELAEHALDQAANMATMAAAAKVRPPAAGAALITKVQLASGRAAAERMRHMFLLGVPLDEDDLSALITDMTVLVQETRDRASRLKGSKGAAAAAQAFAAVQQLGDTKVLYANLLRCVWRARRDQLLDSTPSTPTTPGLMRDYERRGSGSRTSVSSLGEQIESPLPTEPIPEEPEEFQFQQPENAILNPKPKRTRAPPPPPLKLRPPAISMPTLPSPLTPRTPLSPLNPSSSLGHLRRASDFNGARPRLGQTASFHPPARPTISPGINGVPPLPSPGPRQFPQHPAGQPARRRSSATRPLNAWDRRPSFTSPLLSPMGCVPTAELAHTAFDLLDGALKHYRVALTLLSQADVSQRARHKSEVLASIAAASLFRAMLSPRLRIAGLLDADRDQPKRLLNTAEVYSTWAAREVGWSFIIEGTPGAELVDRRTGWEADEAGKRAVLLTLRIWWYRATSDVGADKTTAKTNVARVVKRLRDLEGVGHGDVARFLAGVMRVEGEIDPVEQLFWRSVKRILRGGEEDVL